MVSELEVYLIEGLQSIINILGWFGVACVMAFENATGLIPSEVILGLAGWMLLAANDLPAAAIFLAGLVTAVGSTAGSMLTYWIARKGGRPVLDRAARWVGIKDQHIDRGVSLFHRWGPGLVLFGRMVPGVRTLVTIPAGLARMSFAKFSVFTFIGTYIWCTLLIGLGYIFGHEWWLIRDLLKQYAPWILAAAIAVAGGVVVYSLLSQRQKASASLENDVEG